MYYAHAMPRDFMSAYRLNAHPSGLRVVILIRTLWTDFVNWKENERVFLLYYSDVLFLVVPKGAFLDSTCSNAFRAKLRAIAS